MKRSFIIVFCFIVCANIFAGEAVRAAKTPAKTTSKISKAKLAAQYFKKGMLYYELEEYKKARTYFGKAISLNKKNGIYQYNLAMAYYKDGYYISAERDLKKVIKIEPKLKSRAEFYLGVINYEAGEWAVAKTYLEKVAARQKDNNLGRSAQRMLDRVEEMLRPEKDWGVFVTLGTEASDEVTTEFDTINEADQGNFVDLNLYYRPSWWKGLALDYAYSEIGYQKVTSANVVAQMFRIGSDLNLDPFFYYDYTYTHYWLNGRKYYQSNKIKLMLNYHFIPFDIYARTGFFTSGETKYYFPDQYSDYNANVYKLGIEQTLFDNLQGTVYYNQAQSKSPENDYGSINYALNWYWEFLPEMFLVSDWRYEYRAYNDYFGFNRQDIYGELMVGLRKAFARFWEVAVERRNIRNISNVDFKEYQEGITTFALAVQF